MAFLQHCINGALVAHYALNEPLTIGRAADNDVVLEDSTVSSHHLRISLTDNGHFLFEDLGSTNGVLYQGQKQTSGVLHEGQWLSVGLSEFTRVDSLSPGMEKTLRIKKSWIPGLYYTSEK